MTQYVQAGIRKVETPILTWALVGVVGLLVLSYAYFINASIANALERTSIEAEMSVLTSNLGDIESEYLSLKKGLDISYAQSLGFSEAGEATVRYITKRSDSGLSLNR